MRQAPVLPEMVGDLSALPTLATTAVGASGETADAGLFSTILANALSLAAGADLPSDSSQSLLGQLVGNTGQLSLLGNALNGIGSELGLAELAGLGLSEEELLLLQQMDLGQLLASLPALVGNEQAPEGMPALGEDLLAQLQQAVLEQPTLLTRSATETADQPATTEPIADLPEQPEPILDTKVFVSREIWEVLIQGVSESTAENPVESTLVMEEPSGLGEETSTATKDATSALMAAAARQAIPAVVTDTAMSGTNDVETSPGARSAETPASSQEDAAADRLAAAFERRLFEGNGTLRSRMQNKQESVPAGQGQPQVASDRKPPTTPRFVVPEEARVTPEPVTLARTALKAEGSLKAPTEMLAHLDELLGRPVGPDFERLGLDPNSLDSNAPVEDRNASVLARIDRFEFVQRMTQALQRAQAQSPKHMELQLNPPSLGKLRIQVAEVDGELTAKIEAQTQTARSLLVEQLPALSRHLVEHGIQIQRVVVDEMNTGTSAPSSAGANADSSHQGDNSDPQQHSEPQRQPEQRDEEQTNDPERGRPLSMSDLLAHAPGMDRTI